MHRSSKILLVGTATAVALFTLPGAAHARAGTSTVTPASTTSSPSTGLFTPIATTRIYSGTVGTTAVPVTIAGQAGVPSSATAVVVNAEVYQPSAAGYLRITPAGQDAVVASQEFSRGQTISNLVTVKLSSGKLQVKLSAGSAQVLLDISGYYSDGTGSRYVPLPSARVFASTVGSTPVPAPMAGRGGIPADATAVVVNTEVYRPSATGYVRVTPAGQDAVVAAQEFGKGVTISNLVIAKLSGGALQVKVSAGTAQVLMDVAGYYVSGAGSGFNPIATVREFSGTATTTDRTVSVAGLAGVPGTATAVAINAEVYQPGAAGYLRITPAGQDAVVATQEFGSGQTISNLVIAKVVGGKVQLKVSAGTAQVLLDVSGYYLDGSSGSGVGNDISYPQCGTTYPSDQAFGIVGLNDGKPTDDNPCFASELAWAQGSAGGTSQLPAQIYLNTANPGLAGSWWPTSNDYPAGMPVSNPYGTCAGADTSACAYIYGYAKAYDDLNSRGVSNPTAYQWWLDVEIGNSWESTTSRNVADLEGMVHFFSLNHLRLGIYATAYQWNVIAGTVPTTSPLRTLPNWLARFNSLAEAQAACTGKPLMAGPITMTQYLVTTNGVDLDYDNSCS